MKFGRVNTLEAEGSLLAHSLRVMDQKWKKGRSLTRFDIDLLVSEGVDSLVVAQLEEGDLDEDTAAESLARVLCGYGAELRPPNTGRCNLYATLHGILRIDQKRLNSTNAVDEAFTVATLPPYSRVYPGQLMASVKIIPFGVTRDQLHACISVAGKALPAISVAEFRNLSVSLIQTNVEWFNQSLLTKASRLLKERASELHCSLEHESTCKHHEKDIAMEIHKHLQRRPDVILVLGISAIQDRNDVVPQGIVDAGGRIEHFGMPVDPGNLILTARHGRTIIIGLPGCARSPKRNGFDIVFERVAADIEVIPSDIMGFGAGGLLMEGPRRPERRTQVAETVDEQAPRIAAVVLAAGQSSRMGEVNKLMMEIQGRSVISLVVNQLLKSKVNEVIVVTGYEAKQVEEQLSGLSVKFVNNPEFSKGLSTSLRTALSAVSSESAGILVCLGDMPSVRSSHIDDLIENFDPESGKSICVPVHNGKRGNPVLWSKRYVLEMMEVRGDVGAKHMIGEYNEFVQEVEMEDEGVLIDLDTKEAMDRYKKLVEI